MSDNSKFTTVPTTEAIDNTALIDINNVAKLKEKYGELYQIDITLEEDDEHEGNICRYYFRKPSNGSFNRYLKTAGKNLAKATEAFTDDNIIDEQRIDFSEKALIYPGLPLNCGNKLISALGLGDNINFRKL